MKSIRFVVVALISSLMLSFNAMAGSHGGDRDYRVKNEYKKEYKKEQHKKEYKKKEQYKKEPSKKDYKSKYGKDKPNKSPSPKPVPEIDVAGGAMAAALLMGLLGLVRERKRKL